MPLGLLFAALGFLLVALGWPMATRRVPPNRWYGLRVPATFADEHVWYEANAVAGRDIVALGAVVALVGLILPRLARLPDAVYTGACAAILGVGSFVLAVRSWRLANRLLRERRADAGAAQRPRR